jgi:hypothetical protein
MDFLGFNNVWEQNVGPPLAACRGLWCPAAADWIPLISRFQILEVWIWRPGAWILDASRIGRDWRRWQRRWHSGQRGLEEILTRSSFRSSADSLNTSIHLSPCLPTCLPTCLPAYPPTCHTHSAALRASEWNIHVKCFEKGERQISQMEQEINTNKYNEAGMKRNYEIDPSWDTTPSGTYM